MRAFIRVPKGVAKAHCDRQQQQVVAGILRRHFVFAHGPQPVERYILIWCCANIERATSGLVVAPRRSSKTAVPECLDEGWSNGRFDFVSARRARLQRQMHVGSDVDAIAEFFVTGLDGSPGVHLRFCLDDLAGNRELAAALTMNEARKSFAAASTPLTPFRAFVAVLRKSRYNSDQRIALRQC